jgi:2-oxoglutarate ferredoxin oxidoreductase subunit alpha
VQEAFNYRLQAKYRTIEETEVRFEALNTEDAEYLIVAYGSSARISQKAIEILREKGMKVGLFRPITLYPFPQKELNKLADQVKGMLSVEMSAGQMVEDVRLAVNGKVKVEHFGHFGGVVHSPEEVVEALEQKLTGGE